LGVTPVIKARPEALLAEIKYNAARAGELKDVELSLLDNPPPASSEPVPGTEERRSKLLDPEVEFEEEEEDKRSSTSCVEDAPPAYCVE